MRQVLSMRMDEKDFGAAHARLSPWVRKDPIQRLGVLAPLQRSPIDQPALLGKPDVRIAGWDAEEKACAFNEEETCQNKVNIP